MALKCDIDANPMSRPIWVKGEFPFLLLSLLLVQEKENCHKYFRLSLVIKTYNK